MESEGRGYEVFADVNDVADQFVARFTVQFSCDKEISGLCTTDRTLVPKEDEIPESSSH